MRQHTGKSITHPQFSLCIYARCCFVQNQNARLMSEGTREADELFLSRGEAVSSLAHGRLKAVRKFVDEVGKVDLPCGGADLMEGQSRSTQSDIRFKRSGE